MVCSIFPNVIIAYIVSVNYLIILFTVYFLLFMILFLNVIIDWLIRDYFNCLQFIFIPRFNCELIRDTIVNINVNFWLLFFDVTYLTV